MKTEDIDKHKLSTWIPCTDVRHLSVLGKLGEETAELSRIISRMIIQGVDGVDPDTGVSNLVALQEEIADVKGLSQLATEHFLLNPTAIDDRAEKKYLMKKRWVEQLR